MEPGGIPGGAPDEEALPFDPEWLRAHYAALPDEEFSAIDPADLEPEARQCYDEELARRQPAAPGAAAKRGWGAPVGVGVAAGVFGGWLASTLASLPFSRDFYNQTVISDTGLVLLPAALVALLVSVAAGWTALRRDPLSMRLLGCVTSLVTAVAVALVLRR